MNVLAVRAVREPGETVVKEETAIIRLVSIHSQIIPIVENVCQDIVVPVDHNSIVMEFQGASSQRLFFWSEVGRALLEQKPEDDPAPNQDHYQ
jgi:hypothetical protein